MQHHGPYSTAPTVLRPLQCCTGPLVGAWTEESADGRGRAVPPRAGADPWRRRLRRRATSSRAHGAHARPVRGPHLSHSRGGARPRRGDRCRRGHGPRRPGGRGPAHRRLSTPPATVGEAVTAVGNAGGTGTLTAVSGTVTALDQSITATDSGGGGAEQLSGLIETDAT